MTDPELLNKTIIKTIIVKFPTIPISFSPLKSEKARGIGRPDAPVHPLPSETGMWHRGLKCDGKAVGPTHSRMGLKLHQCGCMCTHERVHATHTAGRTNESAELWRMTWKRRQKWSNKRAGKQWNRQTEDKITQGAMQTDRQGLCTSSCVVTTDVV